MKTHLIIITLILGLACSCFGQNQAQFAAIDLRCEDLVDPIGIDVAKPTADGATRRWRSNLG
jgi:hypothetical protein